LLKRLKLGCSLRRPDKDNRAAGAVALSHRKQLFSVPARFAVRHN